MRPGPDLRLGAAGRILSREHEDEAAAHRRREHAGDAEHVLHGVAEAEAVALIPRVDERAGTRPLERHQRVVGAPHVGHVVEIRVGRLHLQAVEQPVPVRLEFRQFAVACRRRPEPGAGAAGPGRAADAEHDQHVGRRPRRKFEVALDRAAAVVGKVLAVAARPALHGLGPVKAAVDAEEFLAVAVIAGDFAAELGHPPPSRLVPVGEIARVLGQPRARRSQDAAILPHRLGDVLGVLEVQGILQQAPLGRELAEREHAQPARTLAGVRDRQPPVLEVLLQRHEVCRHCPDTAPLALDHRVAEAETRGGPVLVERLAHGLPCGRPEVAAVAVAQVKLAAGHVHRHGVVAVPQETPRRRRAREAVAAGVVGDDGAVAARTEVIGPRPRRVGAGDDIFPGSVVKVSVVHRMKGSGEEPANGPGGIPSRWSGLSPERFARAGNHARRLLRMVIQGGQSSTSSISPVFPPAPRWL